MDEHETLALSDDSQSKDLSDRAVGSPSALLWSFE